MAVPEGYTPMIDGEEEEPPKKNELVYLLGLLYLEASGQKGKDNSWVFESHKACLQGKDFKFEDVGDSLGKIYSRAVIEKEDQDAALLNAENELKKSIEETNKKKAEENKKASKKGGKKGKDAPKDDPPSEQFASAPSDKKEEAPDLTTEAGFKTALKKSIKRPFLFGPVEFRGLDLSD